MLGHESEIEILGDLKVAGVDLEYFLSFLEFGKIDMDLAVKASGPKKSLVQNVSPVRRGKDDDS